MARLDSRLDKQSKYLKRCSAMPLGLAALGIISYYVTIFFVVIVIVIVIVTSSHHQVVLSFLEPHGFMD